MVILEHRSPRHQDFVWCKAKEEKKAWALIDSGYDGSFDGEASNRSFPEIRTIRCVSPTNSWRPCKRIANGPPRRFATGRTVGTFKARELWRSIAQAAWECGDPGLQYGHTVNGWHTCSGTDRINASNPCSEYMFLDDSACNLASLNLRKFLRADGTLNRVVQEGGRADHPGTGDYRRDARYPTKAIEENSLRYRPLGLGYANLGRCS